MVLDVVFRNLVIQIRYFLIIPTHLLLQFIIEGFQIRNDFVECFYLLGAVWVLLCNSRRFFDYNTSIGSHFIDIINCIYVIFRHWKDFRHQLFINILLSDDFRQELLRILGQNHIYVAFSRFNIFRLAYFFEKVLIFCQLTEGLCLKSLN